MRITRDAIGNLTIDQSRFIANIIKKYLGSLEHDFLVHTPLPTDFIATVEDCSEDEAEVQRFSIEYRMDYPSVLGSLIYLMNTRPDISFAVIKLARFMKLPGRKHFQAITHLLHYLRCYKNYGIRYYVKPEDSPLHHYVEQSGIYLDDHIFGMHDSSWQDCPDSGRSTGCYFNFACGGVVDFSSFLPAPVAMSSTEAEMNAGAVAAMSMSYVRMLWNELNGQPADILWDPPIPMFCDNNGAVISANSDKDSKALRHTKRRMFFMRQLRKEKELGYWFMDNKFMLADVGTKNVDGPKFKPVFNIILAEVPE